MQHNEKRKQKEKNKQKDDKGVPKIKTAFEVIK